ncbi:efflux RND transporter permease subunit [Desulforhopalus singaporensis]|uniref:Hydrophobic/amphiphilic exporter-1, HAE1 family n=1 Tax=Desulforhopalus singaporensis TaxID=91360 RepID=A0A1H0LJK8_9BACT|nr:efflux RND transporter permease subunit [Desulforhopalus singaporensis]SDO68354.1 hydrophobic/amphiphilic exporter-1, HAE1 family [Desulforhopalus singaporensis]
MSLPKFSVCRPVFTSMVTLIVIILGLSAFYRLQIDLLPSIEMPTLSIRTNYEGASPEVMERLVTQIIEEIVATVPGVGELTSESSEGRSNVWVRFNWGTDIDTAAIDVQAQLEDEINELPDDIERPRVSKFDVASFPVVIMGISSSMDPVELTSLIENRLRFRLAKVPGVAQVDTWGQFTREIRIEIDPARLNALGLPLNEILNAPKNANLDLPAGSINQGKYEITLRAPAEYISLDQIRDTVIAKQDGGFVTLGQVAAIRDTYEKRNRITRLNGNSGLNIAIRKQPSANTVDVATGVLAEIERINNDFPQILVVPVTNQGNFIERSIQNVARSVLYGGTLAVLVLLLFLRSIRSTLVITVAIPISIIATFAMIYFGGFTINLMTLGGLALGVGMMVDSSVVVLENIYRRRQEHNESAAAASTYGAEEVGTAIFASTVTTLVIFVPLAFIKGVSGMLFKELGFTVMFSLTCSLLVALSLVPMMASKMFALTDHRGPRPPRFPRLFAVSTAFFERLTGGYIKMLGHALNHRWSVVLFSTMVLALSIMLFPYIGSEFLPPSDEGEVNIVGEMEIGTRLDLLDRQTRMMEQLVFPAVPETVSSSTRVGTGWRNAKPNGEIRLSLSPAAERVRSNTEIAADLRKLLAGKIPGMEIRVRAPQGQFILERILGGDQGLTVEVRGFDLDTLDRLAELASRAVENISNITDIEVSRSGGVPQQDIIIDRDKVADLGLTPRDVSKVLETALAGAKVGEFRSGGESARILIQLKDAENLSMDEILGLMLSTPGGTKVTLRNLVTTSSSRGPAVVERKDQQRIISIRANVAGRSLSAVAEDVRTALSGIVIPEGYELRVAGNIEEQQKAARELGVSLVLALVLVFMVLACQYESLRDPIIVMVSVPLAVIGVLLTLYLTDTTLNLQSYIGCIMLGGIVVNNAILLVDQASRLRRMGASVAAAVTEAGRRRLRPILMTTLTTVLALVPLALGVGEGADAQAPLARVVVGGLTASTLITLVLIPVVFTLVHPDTIMEEQ